MGWWAVGDIAYGGIAKPGQPLSTDGDFTVLMGDEPADIMTDAIQELATLTSVKLTSPVLIDLFCDCRIPPCLLEAEKEVKQIVGEARKGVTAAYMAACNRYPYPCEMIACVNFASDKSTDKDQDINLFDIYRLRTEIRMLRNSIRHHRDQRGDDRCWMDDQELYAVLPERKQADPKLPPKEEFLGNCARYCEKFWKLRQPEECHDDAIAADRTKS